MFDSKFDCDFEIQTYPSLIYDQELLLIEIGKKFRLCQSQLHDEDIRLEMAIYMDKSYKNADARRIALHQAKATDSDHMNTARKLEDLKLSKELAIALLSKLKNEFAVAKLMYNMKVAA